ncbi:hypothetical protein PoB_001232000 [Plakobranchus ocellatus]|uniref:7TM GPCR serpentine receptor class x (Srx) domain-containing protein n=1 Tax=Plakobranchus ocellatus TaxID=259542 RepID=A0AAV3YSQ1_9GAST|nr:hypothetical protein PoB_001232000 [Plakobranchus ocellatus]
MINNAKKFSEAPNFQALILLSGTIGYQSRTMAASFGWTVTIYILIINITIARYNSLSIALVISIAIFNEAPVTYIVLYFYRISRWRNYRPLHGFVTIDKDTKHSYEKQPHYQRPGPIRSCSGIELSLSREN